jgi:repressor LexA
MGRTPTGQTREKVYRFIRKRLLAGQPPTVREIQKGLSFKAVQTAHQHLAVLVQQGRLIRLPGNRRARGYRLPGAMAPAAMVPLVGRVHAGALAEAIEASEGYVPARADRFGGSLFALRVRGESMTGAGIQPDDLVIVRRQQNAESGDIVVAMVEGDATVKRLRLRRGRVELQPENPAFDVIVPRQGEVEILGKVIEVRRYLE